MADPLDPQGAQSTPNTDAASTPSYTIGAPAGLLEPGTIDLNNRPVVSNADGTHSSEYSTSFGDDKGREVLVPTVVKGKFLTPDGKKPAEGSDAEQQMFTRAQKHYEDTHEHLGIFSSADAADKYANTVHLRNEPIVVSAPDGSKVSFPKGTPTPQVNAEMSKWWEGHTQRAAQLWSGVKNYVSNASQAMGGPASIPELDADTKDFLLNPDETLKGAIGGLLKGMNTAVMSLGPGNEENKAMVQRAQQEWHDGNHLAAATTMIPLVGDGLAKAVKQAQAHDFSGSFGTATGVALPFVAGDAGINEGLGDTAAQLRGRYLPKSTLTEAAPVAAPVAATEAPKSEVAHGADAFNAEHGRPPVEHKEVAPSPHAKAIADEYDKLKHDPSDPAVQKSYDAMKSDIDDQWNYATQKMGMTFEPWKGEGQPYKNSKEMAADVKDNKHLYFYQGGDLPADHPLGETDEATGLSYNDKLRAVHDLFGHAANGNQFGPAGEERAWQEHRQMFSPEAVPAVTTETRGQNSWVNSGAHLRDANGNVPAQGEPGYTHPSVRPYAENKAALLPQWAQEPEGKPTIDVSHWSKQRVPLTETDPETFGQGRAGAERNRTSDPGFIPRTYFGMEGYKEPAVQSGALHTAKLDATKYYDKDADSSGLWLKGFQEGGLTGAEQAVKAAGYDGYYSPEQKALASFTKVPVKAAIFDDISKLHNADGGATFNPLQGDMNGKDAFAVPAHPELSMTVDGEKTTPAGIQKYMSDPKVAEALKADPNLSVGTWAHEGKTYYDLSKTVTDRDEAIALGKANNQIAIRDLKNGVDIPTGGTGTPLPKSVGAASIDDLNTKEDVPTFFSKAARVIDEKAANTASGEQLAALLKNNGVKPDEMKWAGLDDFLKDKPKVSKAELQQFIKENQIQLKDVDLGKPAPTPEMEKELHEQVMRNGDLYKLGDDRTPAQESEYQQGVARAKELEQQFVRNPTKYDKWTVPGERENYQEKLLTLPTKESPELQGLRKEYNDAAEARDNYVRNGQPVPGDVELRFQDAQNAMRKMKNEESTSRDYVAPHFGGAGGDQPTNIVAHVRFDDRPAVDGKKTLFMEEAQSDWHSAGRHEGYSGSPKEIEAAKKAWQDAKAAKTAFVQSVVDRINATPYATPEELAEYDAIRNKIYDRNKPLTPEERDAENLRIKELDPKIRMNNEGPVKIDPNSERMSERIRTAMTSDELNKFDKLNTDVASKYQATKALQGAVPDAPFKQSWHELVMKRMLREAAEKGYDRLAWTTGDQQADLYDLSKHIGRIEYDPEQNTLRAFDPQGKNVLEENVDPTVKELAPYIGQEHAKNLVDQIESYESASQPDPDMFYDNVRESYDIDEREVPDENEEMETVPEREDFDEHVSELAKKYRDKLTGLNGRSATWNDLEPFLTPEELADGQDKLAEAKRAEEEQEENRGTVTQYYVTRDGEDVDGPHDNERDARENMGERIDQDVQNEMDEYEPEQPELPSITNLNEHKGGEFHSLLYDTMIPSFLKKYAKKWGAQVGTTEIKGMGTPEVDYEGPNKTVQELQDVSDNGGVTGKHPPGYSAMRRLGDVLRAMRSGKPFRDAMLSVVGGTDAEHLAEHLGGKFIKTPANQKVHSIEITPAMRQSVMKEGQPIAKKEDKKKPFGRPGQNPEQNTEAANFKQRLNDRMLSALS